MSVIRAFIAIDLSTEIQDRLEKVEAQLRSRLPKAPVRWVPVKNIHLTLKFLGDVSTANLDLIKRIIEAGAHKMTVFELSIGELGGFPAISRPRVVWVGVEAPPELYTLQEGIESETSRLGYPEEKRSFSPHLTLGRVSRNASSEQIRQVGDLLSKCQIGFIGATRVEAVHLYRSDLQPQGAIYTRLFSAPLVQ